MIFNPGDKFRNMISGNEGTIRPRDEFYPGGDRVAVSYNSPAYGADKIIVYPERSALIKIPHFRQQEGDDTNAKQFNDPGFPPGTRAVHLFLGLGTVSSPVIKGRGTDEGGMVYFLSDTSKYEWTVYVKYLKLSDAEPVDESYGQDFSSTEPALDMGPQPGATKDIMPEATGLYRNGVRVVDTEATRTNQLLNELYHDRARLERVVADAADVIETLGSAIERITDSEDFSELAPEDSDLMAVEYGNWLLGIAQQFVDTHGEQE